MGERNKIKPRWQKGESGNPAGRPKGAKNRSTIARYWLEVNQKAKNPIDGTEQTLSQEDLMTLALVKRAKDGDVNAYKALMDSAFGAPTQQIEQTQVNYDFTDLSTDEIKEMLKEDE